MSGSLAGLVGAFFTIYLVVGGALVIMGYKKVGDILAPLVILLLAITILPSLAASFVSAAFKTISPWWVTGICAVILIGLLLRRSE